MTINKMAFVGAGTLLASFGSADRATVVLKNHTAPELMLFAQSSKFPLAKGSVIISKSGDRVVELAGPKTELEAARQAIAAWDVRADAIDLRAVWKAGGSETVSTAQCLTGQSASMAFGNGADALQVEVSPRAKVRVSSLITLQYRDERISTVVSGESSLSIVDGFRGPALRITTGDPQGTTDLHLGAGWKGLVGASLSLSGTVS